MLSAVSVILSINVCITYDRFQVQAMKRVCRPILPFSSFVFLHVCLCIVCYFGEQTSTLLVLG